MVVLGLNKSVNIFKILHFQNIQFVLEKRIETFIKLFSVKLSKAYFFLFSTTSL